ncbi:hypothetical protein JX265_012725 [Neoarthrinium moseri]|uniref:Uncharacterized protein n=1 Tax=Neoarthrinium moseri TaxID=1658444 RepID=A0A9P9W9P1_9PEZI|nr:uncharacterized protein JN550_008859 [Neoarthrinium moseri]KAI1849476.1 hypothetical protein JX266_004971 [Neoarthrinium moseri]KAI1853434.1 hypothetical protein JX265_012725 [Neoarthrinium moseri]KAI1864572.1 hypothetical protein JN550_008859 [Neoarthrinium moseri]
MQRQRRRETKASVLHPKDLLPSLNMVLRAENYEMSTSCLMMRRTSAPLLERVHEACVQKLRDTYGVLWGLHEGDLIALVSSILRAFKEIDSHIQVDKSHEIQFSAVVHAAAHAVNTFIQSEKGRAVSANLCATQNLSLDIVQQQDQEDAPEKLIVM